MRFAILLLLVLTTITSHLKANEIVFSDGKKLQFESLVRIFGRSETGKLFGPNERDRFIRVDFNGAVREIPWEKIVCLKINKFERHFDKYQGEAMKEVEAELTTSTGVTAKCKFSFLWHVKVKLLDELSGEKKIHTIPFVPRKGAVIKELHCKSIKLDK